MTVAVVALSILVLFFFLLWRYELIAHVKTARERAAFRVQCVALRAERDELRERKDDARVKSSSRRLMDAYGIVDPNAEPDEEVVYEAQSTGHGKAGKS